MVLRQKISHMSEFIAEFIVNPGEVGSISPSSAYLAQSMVAGIPAGGRDLLVAEFGPGSGAVTRHLDALLADSGRLVAFEVNPRFQKVIKAQFPRVDLRPVSAAKINCELSSSCSVDHIVSSIPFTLLPEEDSCKILEESFAALRPGGSFTTFLYLQSFVFTKNFRFIQLAKQLFGETSHHIVMRNMPPAVVLRFFKGEKS